MSAFHLRIGLGLVLMASVCSIALRIGGAPERRTALLMGGSWSLAMAAELVTGRQTEPVIAGDFAFGVGLLVMVWVYGRAWLWILFLMEAVLFFMHAFLYQSAKPPGGAYILAIVSFARM